MKSFPLRSFLTLALTSANSFYDLALHNCLPRYPEGCAFPNGEFRRYGAASERDEGRGG